MDYQNFECGVPNFFFALREGLKEHKILLPTQADANATGYDVRSAHKGTLVIDPLEYVKIPLGFRTLCPEGWWFELKPRSSSFAKKYLHCLYGTIDENFEGELVLACQYIPPVQADMSFKEYIKSPSNKLEINFGDAIGQIIPVRRRNMNVLEVSNDEMNLKYSLRNDVRGTGGFGSSDK